MDAVDGEPTVSLDLSHDEEFRILKLYLQIHVIEEILKKEDIDCNKRDRFNEVLTTSKCRLNVAR